MKQYKEKVTIAKVACFFACMFICSMMIVKESIIPAVAANSVGDMAVYSGVTISPDGTAWTTDYLDRTNERLPEGYTIATGQQSRLRSLNVGEHYYSYEADGSVNVGKWVVAHSYAQCIHSYEKMNYKGFETQAGICEKYYNNGWNAYCADCGELVDDMLIYGKSSTVTEILSMPAQATYLYICPYCEGLEQGRVYQHICKDISYNRYSVSYVENAPENTEASGYMAVTRHMYDNASLYEGMDAKKAGYGDIRLRKNNYTCEGYVFECWNTEADGSGKTYEDGQEVINMTEENNGVVVLYAQWKRVESTLCINPNGGTYAGNADVTSISKGYGESYFLDSSKLVPAQGYLVTFEANGGVSIDDLQTQKRFFIWQKEGDFQGDFRNDIYTYTAGNGHIDTITAVYQDAPFVLPTAEREGYVFAGWYNDEGCTEFVGHSGDEFLTDKDMTLYAKWSLLVLTATDNYEAYDGSGAVDLSWSQPDETEKYYKLYQSLNKTDWTMIYDADTITNNVITVSETINYHSAVKNYVVQNAGYYTLSAYGAKGGDFAEHVGGSGGYTTATYWLKKGDIITIYGGTTGNGMNGGVNDSIADGGSSTSANGAGGGAGTEIYITRNSVTELLMIAGGGGGANSLYTGGTGGSSLTSVSDSAGMGSVSGGGGGGAQGGTSDGSSIITTIDNPAIEDIAFMSDVTKRYRDYCNHAIAGYMGNNKADYPVYQTETEEIPWKYSVIQTIGDLNGTIHVSETERSDDEEYHYWPSINNTASVGDAPAYNCLQAGEGFARTFTATYPTNGNTHLVLSASQSTNWGAQNGYIEFMVNNADSGEVIHTKRIVESNGKKQTLYDDEGHVTASGKHLRFGCWTDLFIPEDVEHVMVTVKVYICAEDAHTNAYFTDAFFYGGEHMTIGPTAGGSSYINTGYGCKDQAYSAGENSGAGYGTITGKIEAFLEETSMENVMAKDMAAPDEVMLKKEEIKALGTEKVKVTWTEPLDNGTTYYHKCESYFEGEKQLESNITKNTLSSGVQGYYYYIDSNSTGTVTKSNAYVKNMEHKGSVTIVLKETQQYLHVAAVDVAGNLSGTSDISVDAKNEKEPQYPTDDSYPAEVGIFTEQLVLEETEFVHQGDEKSWYVKADGVAEHTLKAKVGMDGAATSDFQISSIQFNISKDNDKEWFRITIPHGNITRNTETFYNDEMNMSVSGQVLHFLIPQNALAERMNHGTQIVLSQKITITEGTPSFKVYPQAIAEFKDKEYCSENEQDVLHGLTIIPDGEAPEIFGVEELQNLKVLDMTEQSKRVVLWAEDALSGLQEFIIFIYNIDNHMKAEFLADEEGKVEVEINKENPLFIGEIAISALAVDRVSNVNIVGDGGLTFTLETNLYKERNPEGNVFKTGDGAILDIFTSGYVERIEVIFPEELLGVDPGLNRIFEYEHPALRQKESLKFHIPLGVTEQEYEVTVKAYKNGHVLISKPTFVVVKGTVLNELRTRIRNNG